jgi:hypothetical protein
MAARILLVLWTLLFFPRAAHAEEVLEHTDRDSRAWGDRSGWNTEIAVGSGIGVIGRGDERRDDLAADTTIRIGFHKVGVFHGKSLLGLRTPGLAWCMPLVMCGPVGLLIGPESGFLGNELGVDVAAHLLHGVSDNALQFGYAFGLRPALRVARDSRFRTASYLGSLVPEVGFAFPSGRARELYLEFNLYPLSLAVTRDFAIHWDVLRERLGVPLDGTRVSMTIGTSLAVMLL